ncbi:unnamed protein product, partial [Mesorhabditis belari]|uniref:Uncharacterized protein n=1 Tax=Mesorhabditis belari TaxID=2138241 RepID=A0AAF3FD24_9BILA
MDEEETAESLKEGRSETTSFVPEYLPESSFEKSPPAIQDSQCTLSSNATTSSIDSRSQHFPHCAICGFNVEVYLVHYRRIRPPTNNNWIFRFKCRRKTCNKFFGHSWTKKRDGEFEIINEDATFENLPFFSRFNPDIDPAEYNKIVTPHLAEQHGSVRRGRPKKIISPLLVHDRGPVRGAPIKISLASPPKSSADKPLLLQDQDELKMPIDECTNESIDVTVNKSKDEPFVQSEVSKQPKSQKGYAYVLEFAPQGEDLPKEKKPPRLPPKRTKPLKHDGVKEFGVSNAPLRVSSPNDASIRRFHCWTQTMDLAHVTSFAIDEVMKRNAKEEEQITSETSALEPGPSMSTNKEAVSARQLIVASHAIGQARKSEEKMRVERDRLKDALALLLTQMHSLKRQHIEDTRRIRDDIDAAKHEMRTYHGELGIEANMIKSVIDKVKKAQGEKLKDIEKNNKKLKGQLELMETKYQHAEAQSNKYHRELEERDRKVALVTAEKLEVAKKLEDKLFLDNNQKCFHCTESSNLKNFYERQAKTKAETVDKLEAENRKLISELEGSQQIVTTLKKNEGRLKYERDTYEAENRRLLARPGTEEENLIKNDQSNRSSDGTKSASPQIHSSPNGYTVPSQSPKQTQATHKLAPLPTFAPLSTTDQVPVAFANWITKPKPAEPLGKTMTDQHQRKFENNAEKKKKKLEKRENPEVQASTEKVELQATKETTAPEPTTSQIPLKKPRVETPPIIVNGLTSSIAKERVNSPVPNAQSIKKIVSPSPQNGQIAKKPLPAPGGSKIVPPKANPAHNKVSSRPTYLENSPKPVVKPSWLQHEARQNVHRPHPNEPAPNMGRYWNPQIPVVNGPINPPPPGVDWNRDAGLPWHRRPNAPNGSFNPPPSNDSWVPPSSNIQRRGFWE